MNQNEQEGKMKFYTLLKAFVLVCGMAYVCFATMAIGKLFGSSAAILSVLAGAIGLATIYESK